MASHGRAGKNAVPAGNSPKARGRTAQTTAPDGPNPTEGHVQQERLTESNRPIGSGGGKLRGDRRDTHPDPGTRNNGNLRNDRNPSSTAGRRNNRVPNEGG